MPRLEEIPKAGLILFDRTSRERLLIKAPTAPSSSRT